MNPGVPLAVRELMKPATLTLRFLWVVLSASILVFVVVAFAAAPPAGTRTNEANLELILALVAVGIGLLSLVLPRFLLNEARIREFLQRPPELSELVKSPTTGQTDPARSAQVETLTPLERKLATIPSILFTPLLVQLTLNESIVVLGLVFAILSADPSAIFPYAAAALLLNVLSFPRVESLLERALVVAKNYSIT